MCTTQVGTVLQQVTACSDDDAACAQLTVQPPSPLVPSCAVDGQQNGQQGGQQETETCPANLDDQQDKGDANDDGSKSNTPHAVPMLTSGAGHDALAMAALTKVGMVFVRCRGGISHNPLEHVEPEDVGYATATVFAYIRGKLLAGG